MQLKIITPEKVILDVPIKGVFVKAIDGELGVLPGHEPLMTALDIATASYLSDSDEREYVSIIGGIFKVDNNEVLILTENAELGEDIDETRAKLALDRAKAVLEGAIDKDKDSMQVENARMSMLKALARLKTKQRGNW